MRGILSKQFDVGESKGGRKSVRMYRSTSVDLQATTFESKGDNRTEGIPQNYSVRPRLGAVKEEDVSFE